VSCLRHRWCTLWFLVERFVGPASFGSLLAVEADMGQAGFLELEQLLEGEYELEVGLLVLECELVGGKESE